MTSSAFASGAMRVNHLQFRSRRVYDNHFKITQLKSDKAEKIVNSFVEYVSLRAFSPAR
jgi:hypothetical protein